MLIFSNMTVPFCSLMYVYRSGYNTISGYITGSHFDGDLSLLTSGSANYIKLDACV